MTQTTPPTGDAPASEYAPQYIRPTVVVHPHAKLAGTGYALVALSLLINPLGLLSLAAIPVLLVALQRMGVAVGAGEHVKDRGVAIVSLVLAAAFTLFVWSSIAHTAGLL